MKAERGVYDVVSCQSLKAIQELRQFPLSIRTAQGFGNDEQGCSVAGANVVKAGREAEPDRRDAAVRCHGINPDQTRPDFLMAEGASSRAPRAPSIAVEPCSIVSLSEA